MALLAAVVAAGLGGAGAWAAAAITGLVAWLAAALLTTVRSRDDAERLLAAELASLRDLSRHVDGAADLVHAALAAARSGSAEAALDPAAGRDLDRAGHGVDDVTAVVAALADAPTQPEVVEVWRVVRHALCHVHADVTGEGRVFVHTRRRAFEAALRLIASTLGDETAISVTVRCGEGTVKTTISADDDGLDIADAEAVFGHGAGPFAGHEELHHLSLARAVARHGGGDVAYVRALGRSNYVVSMPAVEVTSEATPPILTLALPLDRTAEATLAGRH